MNVTFSCKVLSRWAQLVSVFSRMFKFSRIVIYRAKSRRSDLEWGDLLILFNRNNCSLSVGVFSSSLICESIAVQFHWDPRAVSNLCSARGANSCGERFSILPRGQRKGRFFSRSAHLGNVYPFLVGATNTFSELIHPLIKLPNCVLKFYIQFIRSARLFRLTPPSRSGHRLCWRTTAASTHFWSSTLYTTFHGEAMLMLGFFSLASHALRACEASELSA